MDQTQDRAERVRGGRLTTLARTEDPVFEAVMTVLDGRDLQLVDADRTRREARFTCRADPPNATWTYTANVEPMEGVGTMVAIVFGAAPSAAVGRGDKRAGKRTARRVLEEIEAAVAQVEPSEAEAAVIADFSGSAKGVLAGLTGRRAWLGALALLVAYAVPLLAVWLIGRAAGTGLLGDGWVPITLAMVVGFALYGVLSWKLGAEAKAVQWGEEYMLTFGPVAGYFLGWWRFAVQLGALIAIAFLTSGVEDEAGLRQMTNAETQGLPAYAQRAPAPAGSEPGLSSSIRQSEYVGRPNATYSTSYAVAADVGLDGVEAYLRDPAWADGVDGGPALGALQDISCEPDTERCEAEVVPDVGEPVEYTVTARLSDSFTVVLDDGRDGALLYLEIEYEQDASRS